MTDTSGDRYEVHIGGNASAPVVVGRDNSVNVHGADPQPAQDSAEEPTATSSQANTAREHGTVFAVTGGDMHVHQVNPASTDS